MNFGKHGKIFMRKFSCMPIKKKDNINFYANYKSTINRRRWLRPPKKIGHSTKVSGGKYFGTKYICITWKWMKCLQFFGPSIHKLSFFDRNQNSPQILSSVSYTRHYTTIRTQQNVLLIFTVALHKNSKMFHRLYWNRSKSKV